MILIDMAFKGGARIPSYIWNSLSKRDEVISKVAEGLYIGNMASRNSTTSLGIKYVINLTIGTDPGLPIIELHLPINDNESTDLYPVLVKAVPFIDGVIKRGEKVLVHCQAGMSRSASVVCAYLMWQNNLEYQQAIYKLREVHPIASPNRGFVGQLEAINWQLMEFDVTVLKLLDEPLESTDAVEVIADIYIGNENLGLPQDES